MTGDDRVYGMGLDPLVEPDWPALTSTEVKTVLGPLSGSMSADAVITWRSPRPLSATALVRLPDGDEVIVKRLPRTLRDAAALGEEHRFMDHLRARGIPVPRVRHTADLGEFTYEVQEFGSGADEYAGVFSWTPYLSLDEAAAAGHMLARLHLAATDYDAPRRPARPLLASFTIFASPDPLAAVADRAVERPALGAFLAERDWRTDITRVHLPAFERLRPLLTDLEPLWTHNDWHGTNLLWRDHEVTSVIDFGLCDRTTAIHDLATAIERCAVDWISIRDGGPARVRVDQVGAMLRAYESVRPLTAAERRALPALLPLVHCEYELSEIDYFLGVIPGGNPKNAEIAYTDYFLGHTGWWTHSSEARTLLSTLTVA
ncbi:phosphotransferase enzyme family protein [Nocardia sp. CDC160]|uniref:phosphotransferase enzyme family protein n=1 Tax=Nocardia sp. CDC160 TaxID=3112166 RepID=UPI002DB8437B|nr:phosphotransferase [Nocardia sp. CDC160]MEC3920490.1 phosphotransferase [Nocardia sp. CDC160]